MKFKKITASRNPGSSTLLVWVGQTMEPVNRPQHKMRTIADMDWSFLELPKRDWYYRVTTFTPKTEDRGVRVRIVRVKLDSDDGLMLWPEAFELFLAYARML